jgi:hypothetical protein
MSISVTADLPYARQPESAVAGRPRQKLCGRTGRDVSNIAQALTIFNSAESRRVASVTARRLCWTQSGVEFLPMASAATPVSAAAEQQHHNKDDEDQIHGRSPLRVMTSRRELAAMD